MVDLITLTVAFVAAHALTPLFQMPLAPGGALRAPWLEFLSLPSLAELGDWRPLSDVWWMLVVTAPIALLFVQLLGGYRPILEQSRTRVVLVSLLAPLAGLATIVLVLFALKYQRTSRMLVFSYVLFSAAGLSLYRTILRSYKRRRFEAGHYARDVALVGPTVAVEQLAAYFNRSVPPARYRIAGYLRLHADQVIAVPPGGPIASPDAPMQLPSLGDVADLGEVLIHRPIHEVYLVLSGQDSDWLRPVVEACDYFRVTLRVIPAALLDERFRDLSLPPAGAVHLPQIVLTPRHLDSDALFVKRLMDIVVASALLVLLSPLLAIIALAIKLTTPRLPVLYPWRVIGYKGRPFTGYKFTTMVADADSRKPDLMHLNEMSGPVFKIKADPRVTSLGRFLRKFSLNELPQLWSVLRGDMSLVGPRPAFPHELPRYELWHKRKLAIQPGITCLWQVSGRNQISSFDDWVRMDLEYIDNWSLWLDVKILVRTAWVVLAGTGS